ncbi:MAG: zinc ribbon domain-containing protein [bacterium]|nr:zinc ribbon domain-containing protein [Candidatus Kapabacteria bacterium]
MIHALARCTSCPTVGHPDDRYCPACGSPMVQRCRSCGAECAHLIATYCTECGERLRADARQSQTSVAAATNDPRIARGSINTDTRKPQTR